MKPEDLLENVVLLDSDNLIRFVTDNENGMRLCFLQAHPSTETNKIFQRVISSLAQKSLADWEINTPEIQSLYTHLAFFFKKANKWQYVDTCTTNIEGNIFKRRLSAWLHYKRYNTYQLHLDEFENYLSKLSLALDDGDDDYTYEILSDLHEYKTISIGNLPEKYKTAVIALFEDNVLNEKYPLLKQHKAEELSKLPDIDVVKDNGKIHIPTLFAQSIFLETFITYVKDNDLFGYSIQQAAEEVIKKGQANFDLGYQTLTSTQVVKLYCYCNMRMHYFSSLSIFERSKLLDLFYKTNGKIKFIDIGCGPATSGLAFVEYIYARTGLPSIFDYFGIDISITMQQQGKEMMTNVAFPSTNTIEFCTDIEQIDEFYLENSSCIILNACYVFASEHLPIDKIITYINRIKIRFPYTPKYLLFQNPVYEPLNRRYLEFKASLVEKEVIYTNKERIFYYNQRNQYGEPKYRDVFFEILKL
ncbi:hypothetical protein SAMN05518672_10936 [Chitinophaga sp. CF118]|uniref:hypothetical protein n=1 Tax=Chitinophaga sp. CF118 TaxID=1884367 RepID=UPI0008EA02E3|nr:hypothetical protein [Chitinophaga sp. CF118]SFE67498.1 hypothetical protein SAMN05518672_10936 [Chitinophaga sp. CF118]